MINLKFIDYVWPVKDIKPYRYSLQDIKSSIREQIYKLNNFANAETFLEFTPQFTSPIYFCIRGDKLGNSDRNIEIRGFIRPPRRKRSEPEIVIHPNIWNSKINRSVKEALFKALESLKCYL